jgi:hypothetical protein
MPAADAMIARVETDPGRYLDKRMMRLIAGRWCNVGDYDVIIPKRGVELATADKH